jgi:hypothetical protein
MPQLMPAKVFVAPPWRIQRHSLIVGKRIAQCGIASGDSGDLVLGVSSFQEDYLAFNFNGDNGAGFGSRWHDDMMLMRCEALYGYTATGIEGNVY